MTFIPAVVFNAALKDIRAALAGLGPDPDQSKAAFIIIGTCLARGLNTKNDICKIAKGAAKNTRQVATILDKSTGDDPELYPWHRDSDGRYWKHPT